MLGVELGSITGTGSFVVASNPAAIPNAVRITANDTVDFSFAPGQRSTSRKASAVREATESVGFSVGSFLAGVDLDGNGIADAIPTPLRPILDAVFLKSFGGNATLLGYDGLVGSSVNLADLAVKAGFGSPTKLLASSISARDFLLASADALPQDGTETAAINVLNAMAATASMTNNLQLGKFIKIDQPGDGAAAAGQLDVLGLLTSSAFVINGKHTVTVPGLALGIPGVGNVVVTLDVTEAAQIAFGPVGTFAETAQARLTVSPQRTLPTDSDPTINSCNLLGSLLALDLETTVGCLSGPLTRLVELEINASVPIDLKAAGAKATVTEINCQGSPEFITLNPDLLPLSLNSSFDVTFSGRLKKLNGTTIATFSNILKIGVDAGAVAPGSSGPVSFDSPDDFGKSERVGSTPLGLAALRV
jgi:hypothetical protein